jgi:hypothetical protein
MKRVLSIVTIVICCSFWADAQAQTIADMARRERAKRAAENQTQQKKAAPITNSQLKPKAPSVQVIEAAGDSGGSTAPAAAAGTAATTPASTPGVAAPIAGAAAAVAAADTATPPTASTPTTPKAAEAPAAPPQPSNEPPARDEKWWRQQFEAARANVRRAENQVAVAELEFNAANRDFLQTSYDPDGRGPAAINAAKAKMEAAQKSLADARAKVVKLEEELRQAGAPAGWAR